MKRKTMSLRPKIRAIARTVASAFEKTPTIDIDLWSEQHIILDSSSSARSGAYSADLTPYLREVMKMASPSRTDVQKIVMMCGVQLTKTQLIINTIFSYAHQDPCPMMMVMPTESDCNRLSDQRFKSTIDRSPTLTKIFTEFSKESGSTMTKLKKAFKGGYLVFTGANSGTGLRSMPARIVAIDEADGMPRNIEGEGSPIELAIARSTTFPNRKILITSTPTLKQDSNILRHFELSDKRQYSVPCPSCGHFHSWTIDDFKWDGADYDSAHIECPNCGFRITEGHKLGCLMKGKWTPTCVAKEKGTVGYQLNSLFSPFLPFSACKQKHVAALNDPSLMQSFTNLVLGLPWELKEEESLSADELLERRTPMLALPSWVRAVTASVDTQGSRFEGAVVGWGYGKRAVIYDHTEEHFGGSTGRTIDEAFTSIIDTLHREMETEDGRKLTPVSIFVDSGGTHTQEVYRLVAHHHQFAPVYAVKGEATDADFLKKARHCTRNNAFRAPFIKINVNKGKDVLAAMLAVKEPSANNYIAISDSISTASVEQLLSETRQIRKGKSIWVKSKRANEMLDLFVYALAALDWQGKRFYQDAIGMFTPSTKATPRVAAVKEVIDEETGEITQVANDTSISAQPPYMDPRIPAHLRVPPDTLSTIRKRQQEAYLRDLGLDAPAKKIAAPRIIIG